MKKLFKYLGILLSVALTGAFAACNPMEEDLSVDVGLGIKVFFPTKVVAGQPMTINGSGFSDATEIVFPAGVTVTAFEIVSNDMIRVVAPSGISPEGGKIIVRTSDDEAESRLPLTVGSTKVSGYSKVEGENIQGGQQLTIYGEDLEFINGVELLDADGNAFVMGHEDFYRKGTSTVIITIPQNIYTGTFAGKITTFDGKQVTMPEFAYEPAPTGHWEITKTSIWKNDGSKGQISWGGDYRFGLEGNDGNNECLATFPQDVWDKMKTGTFYLHADGFSSVQMRLTTGWWSTTWTGNDIMAGDERFIDNGDGTFIIAITLAGDPILDLIDQQHLLFTGGGYTPIELYFQEEVWVENGSGPKEVTFWENDGSKGQISWGGDYRFGLEGNDSLNECLATFPQDVWDIIKNGTFYLVADGFSSAQIRLTTGWWSTTWTGNDIMAGDERLIDNGDGTFTIEINLDGDPLRDAIDQQHLLFTGGGYTPLRLYYMQ